MSLRSRLYSISEFGAYLRAKYVVGFEAPGVPLLDPDARSWFESQIRKTNFYLEFGCGGTTVLADEMGVSVISVESDPAYAEVVRAALRHNSSTKILTPRMGLTGPWGMPVFGRSKKGDRYISAPFHSMDLRFPDLIVVDGRYRAACALKCANEAAKRGAGAQLLFDDYASRKQYHGVELYLGTPRRIGRAAIFRLNNCGVPDEVIREYASDPR